MQYHIISATFLQGNNFILMENVVELLSWEKLYKVCEMDPYMFPPDMILRFI